MRRGSHTSSCPTVGQLEARMPSAACTVRSISPMTWRARRKTTSSILSFAVSSASAVASRNDDTPRIFAAASHCARRLAYSPLPSSCLTLVLMMSSGNGRVVHRHQFGLARAAIEQQQMIFPAHHGNKLVHDAARHAGEFMFGLLAQQGLFDGIQFFAGRRLQTGSRCQLRARRCWKVRRPAARWNAAAHRARRD